MNDVADRNTKKKKKKKKANTPSPHPEILQCDKKQGRKTQEQKKKKKTIITEKVKLTGYEGGRESLS